MKKFVLFLAFLGLFTSLFCFDLSLSEYRVSVQDQDQQFLINLSTSRVQNNICRLIIDKIYVEPPIDNQIGMLDLTVKRDPHSYCLMAFGAHRGAFSFQKGDLPSIAFGDYYLVINEKSYGILHVDRGDTTLTLAE